MHSLPITEKEKDAYIKFVASNNGSFLQSWEWGEWQRQNNREPIRFLILNDDKTPILSAQFLIYQLPLGKTYLYCPYGPVVSAEHRVSSAEIVKQLIQHLKQKYSSAVFIRLEPTYNISAQGGLASSWQPTLHILPGSTILLDIRKDEQTLQAAFHPKTRYNIKVAERHGVQVKHLENPEEIQEAAELFYNTLARRKLATQPIGYYKNLMGRQNASKDLTVHALGAFYNNNLIASSIFIDYNTTRTYLFGGSAIEHKNVMAPYLLHWKAIQAAKDKNLTTYDFFGAEGSVSDGSGFARFKQGFGGNVISYGGTVDIVLHAFLYRAYKLLRTINRLIKHF